MAGLEAYYRTADSVKRLQKRIDAAIELLDVVVAAAEILPSRRADIERRIAELKKP